MEQIGIEPVAQHKVQTAFSWESWNTSIVMKHCDKSIFNNHLTVIPREMYWFFNADERKENIRTPINLLFQGETFNGIIRKRFVRNETKPRAIQLSFDSKLGSIINMQKDVPGLMIVFQKPLSGAENVYYVSLRSPADVSDGPKSWLLNWNPQKVEWKDYRSFVYQTQSGMPVDFSWGCQATEINTGDRIYIKTTGIEESGIIASGIAMSVREVGEGQAADVGGENAKYTIDASLDIVLDYEADQFLSIQTLEKQFSGQNWNTTNVEKLLQEEYVDDLKDLWTKTVEGILSGTERQNFDEIPVKDAVDRIKRYISAAGFVYEDQMIENFYLSLKSKPFVLLAGISGTGKTRLTRLFAEAIGAEYLMVPVRPDWSDSTDLFGHVGLNGTFVPGAILKLLHEAVQNPQKPYILCLDEMNLARVEYYLSDILSVLETREFENERIVSKPLVTEILYGSDEKARETWGELGFPENLYIVGTVNMDETTFPFSRKVLDRANTIEFSYVDLRTSQEETAESVQPLRLANSFLCTDYLHLNQCWDKEENVEKYSSQLQEINDILRKANAHVGYRVRDEVVFYLLNNLKYGLMSEVTAMDLEIMQKILPRISGNSGVVRDMLCDLFQYCAGDYSGYQIEAEGLSAKMLRAAEEPNCRYPRSAKKIAYMMGRLEDDGFTSYWL